MTLDELINKLYEIREKESGDIDVAFLENDALYDVDLIYAIDIDQDRVLIME